MQGANPNLPGIDRATGIFSAFPFDHPSLQGDYNIRTFDLRKVKDLFKDEQTYQAFVETLRSWVPKGGTLMLHEDDVPVCAMVCSRWEGLEIEIAAVEAKREGPKAS